MKWSSILALGILALFVNACEKHKVAELPPEGATAFGKTGWSPEGEAKREEKTAPVQAAAPSAAAAASESPAGEAPKFFPDKK